VAYSYDETNDFQSIADNAALTLPDGDWSIGCWLNLDSNAGTAYQYIMSWGGFDATNSFNLYVGEASLADATDRNEFQVKSKDSGGTSAGIVRTNGNPGLDLTWQHVLVVRASNVMDIYINGSSQASLAMVGYNVVNRTSAFELGRRTDGNSARYFGGDMAEVFKADFAVTADQIAALQVASPAVVLGGQIYDSNGWHIPLLGDVNDRGGNLAVTNNGATVAEHPPIIQPRPKRTVFVPQVAAPGGTFTPYYYTNLLASG
jgi:hypothetical protein